MYCDPKLCTGCRACELVCVGFHERVFNPKIARIRVVRSEPASDITITCHQCEDPPCVKVCPAGAIRKLKSGLVEVIDARCVGCGVCAEACPFGAIWLHHERGKATKCDLCGGDPQCIKHCVPGALKLTAPEGVAIERRFAAAVRRAPERGG